MEQTLLVEMNVTMLHVELAEHNPIQSAKLTFGVKPICDVLVLLTACEFNCL
jgi:hypothetical protein